MNSLKKIGASAGVVSAVVTIIRTTELSSFKDNNNNEYPSMMKWLASVLVGGFLSACGGVTAVIDKYVNQNIATNNKLAQYGLTALEGLLLPPTVFFICRNSSAYTEHFNELFNTGDWKQEHSDGWEQHAITKIMTSSIILLALTFKCIWDSEENTTDDIATPELDLVEMDLQSEF